MSATTEKPLFVFLHGAGLGAYIWDELIQLLPFETLAINFPHRGSAEKIPAKNTLQAYVDHSIAQLTPFSNRNIVLVVHSIGGCVGLELAAHLGNRLSAFVAISASIPARGTAFMDMFSFVPKQLSLLFLRLLGTKPPEKVLRNGLCTGLNDEQAIRVVGSYTPEPLALYIDKITAPIPAVKRYYILLSDDKSFSLEQQRRFATTFAADEQTEIAAGHLVMLSHPQVVKEILVQWIEQ